MSAPRPPAAPPGSDSSRLQREWDPDASRRRGGEDSAETVLLVDDEEGVRNVTRRVLERSGYEVLAAGSPAEAIAAFEEHGHRISLLLTDVIMPVMNGRELADALRVARPELPVLFMSGHSYDALQHRRLGELPFSLLQKPFGPEELKRAVRDRLAAGKG